MAEIDFDTEDTGGDDLNDSQDQPFQERRSGFFTRKRLIIGIIITLFVVSAAVWSMRDKSDSPNPTQAVQKEKPKKKKKSKFKPLYSQLTSTQLSAIIRELSFQGIQFDTAQNGKNFSILVDEEDSDRARTILAIKGLPDGGSKGYELLDNSETLGVTEFDKRIRFLRALSGELEKAIIQFDAIESCKVQIVLPEQRLFAISRPPVTASILIRKNVGAEITDEIVFSIIQLVSKAVENLQPENVSVINTEGNVLSSGIFERIAEKQTAPASSLPQEDKLQNSEFDKGTPILPDIKSINDWLKIKKEFERGLEDKAIRQLLGILPMKSFKLAITSDIGAIENGKILDVKRLSVSIILDNNNQEIFVDDYLKEEIFKTIAPSIGYIKGRDNITLSKADFLTFSEEEIKRLEGLQKKALPIKKYIKWAGYALAAIVTGLVIRWGLRRRKLANEGLEFGRDDNEDTDFDIDTTSNQNITRINDIASTNPEWIAEVLENWISSSDETAEEDF